MKEELLREVEQCPEFEEKPVFVNGVEQKSFKAIVEKGTTEAIAVVKKKYVLVQIRDVLRETVSLLPEETTGHIYYWFGKGMGIFFPKGSQVGIRVLNSVDTSTALRLEFLARAEDGHIYLPRDFGGKRLGAREIHVGEVKRRFLAELQTLSEVVECWNSIVRDLSQKEATEEDLASFERLTGKRAGRRLRLFWERHRSFGWKVSVWQLILEAIRAVGSRKFKSPIHREERLRRLSRAILAYSL